MQVCCVNRRLRAFFVLAALAGTSAGQPALAQQSTPSLVARAKPVHSYARPIAIPQQIAPPQEAFASLPEKAAASPVEPTECDQALAKIAVAPPLGALIAPGECGAPDAVRLETVVLPDASKVTITPPATLRCKMALNVAQWLREDVAPAASKLGAPLRVLENLGSYECRGRDRVRGATLSEHGRADALDVHSFKLANGKLLVLADTGTPKDFRDAVRASACARFMTVLGPGSDAEHAEHVHIDREKRRNNYKLCEWDVREPAALAEGTPIPIDEVPLPRPRPIVGDAGAVTNLRR